MKVINLGCLVLFLFLFSSCEKQPLPNDDIRKLLSENNIQKDTLATVDSLLTKLDNRNIKFCDYINYTHYQIQDSCDAVAAKEFPDVGMGEYTDEYYEFHHKIVSSSIDKYNNKLAIDRNMADLATYVFVVCDNIKTHCGLSNSNEHNEGVEDTSK